jgi:hypothetical protein
MTPFRITPADFQNGGFFDGSYRNSGRSLKLTLAEAVRFELTGPCEPPVFKFTVELNQIKSLADFRLRNLLQTSVGTRPVGFGLDPRLRRRC